MKRERESDPRFVKRTTNPHFEEDLQFLIQPGGPQRYARESSGPVQYVSVADARGSVIGYVWVNDRDAAANWIVRKDGGSEAFNEGDVWVGRLYDATARGLAPSEALAEMIRDSPFVESSHVVPGSLAEAPYPGVLEARAGQRPKGAATRPASGVLFGLALGDAMGYPTEFLTMEQIGARFGPWHTMELPLSPGGGVRVSDDTQMMLAVGEALAEATGSPDSAAQGRAARGAEGERDVRGGRRPQGAAQQGGASLTPAAAETALRKHFVRWLRDPDNNRAPGRTCLDACAALERDVPWQAASIVTSKGCGANMRVAPVALVPGLTAEQRSGLAQLQAALTHGHPTALAASDLTAHAVWLLVNACPLPHLLDELRAYARASQRTYHADWLGDLAQRAGAPDPETYIAFGWDECLRALDRVSEALREPDVDQDPSTVVGAGWVAEEALATALYCFLVVGGDARHALRRAAHSSGDSDSIAALAGAFAGAVHGIKYWPPEWREVIEYGDRLGALGTAWD